MTLANFKNFIPNVLNQYPLEGGTYYGKAMKMIRSFYFPLGRGESRKSAVASNKPVYVMFVTDGATADNSETEQRVSLTHNYLHAPVLDQKQSYALQA